MPAYKDEKRGTWYVRFRYTDWTGKRIETTKRGFLTKREAKEYEDSAKKDRTASSGMTLRQLYKVYCEDMLHRLKPSTYQTKQAIIERHVLPYFAGKPLESISPAVVRKWQSEAIIGKNYSQTYMKAIQNQLSALMNYAVKYYGLPSNPVHIAGSIGRTNAGEMSYWTKEEFNRVLSNEESPMYRAAFLTLFWCGLRIGELLALTGKDIDFEAHTISVTKTYNRIKSTDYITAPKTHGSIRTIKAPQAVMDALKKYMDMKYGFSPENRIFAVISPNIRRRLTSLAKAAGVKPIRLHDLRHSHASYLINNNIPIKLISARLGHDNVQTTLRIYSHMYEDSAAVVEALIEKDSDLK